MPEVRETGRPGTVPRPRKQNPESRIPQAEPESETSSAEVKEKQTTVNETMATMRSRKF